MFKAKLPEAGSLKRFVVIFLSVGIAVSSTLGLKSWAVQNRPMENVLVASHDIPAYRVITSQDLGYVSLPVGSRQPNAIQNPKDAVGKMAVITIYRGEQILPQKLGENTHFLGSGDRLISIPVDAVKAVGMSINAGDKVDVYWVPNANNNLPSKEQNQTIVPGIVIAENATVIDIKNKNSQSLFGEIRDSLNNPGGNSNNKNNDQQPAIGVLKVKNSEVPQITGAIANGMIILVKRGGETNEFAVKGN